MLTGLIVKQPDLGTGLACVAIATSMLFVAGMEMKYLGYAILASILPLYILLWRVPFRRRRLMVFIDPTSDPLGAGFHMIQSLIAVATGGITGQGLMEGKQKLFYLPEPHTDFIFAVTAEELGLLGSVIVVVLFTIFLYRGIRAAVLTEDVFGRLLATGITAMVVVQAFFNVSVVLGLLPTKGIPLPFISYGGSSLFITLASVGVLLNITQQAE
jgi:cell division protein FtsW